MVKKKGDTSWPILSTNFVPKEALVIKGVVASYSVYLPMSTFVKDASTFADVDVKNASKQPLVTMMWFQFWLFCLDVFQRRIDYSSNQMEKYPITVVLEQVYDDKKKRSKKTDDGEVQDKGKRSVIGYSFHIFQTAVDETLSLSNIFADAVATGKVVNTFGYFQDGSTKQPGNEKNKGAEVGTVHADGKPSASNSSADYYHAYQESLNRGDQIPPLFTLYKMMHGRQIFTHFADAYTGLLALSRDEKVLVNSNATDPSYYFNFDLHVKLRPKNTAPWQLSARSYKSGEGADTTFQFTDTSSFYVLQSKLWGVNYVMTRMLPHVQFNVRHLQFAARMLRYANVADAHAAVCAEKKKRLEASHDSDSDMDSSVAGEEEKIQEGRENWQQFESQVAHIERVSEQRVAEIVDFWGVQELATSSVDDGAKDEMTIESEVDDQVMRLKHLFALNSRIIEQVHSIPVEGRDPALTTLNKLRDEQELRKTVFEKYARDCTKGTSDVSKAQKLLNKHFMDNDMKNKVTFKLPLVDPSMVPWHQYMVYLNQGFTHHCDVATGARLITFGWISMSGRFVIERKLHPHLVLSGEGGEGKSHAIDIICANILEDSVTRQIRASKYNDATDGAVYDEVLVNDELSFGSLSDDDERLAMAKSIATNGENAGSRLVAVKDKAGNSKMKATPYRNIIIRSFLAGLNQSAASFIRQSKTNPTSVEAYVTRLTFVEWAKINSHRNIAAAKAASAGKSPAAAAAAQEFVNRNIGLHCILGHAWKLKFIGVMELDMKLFEPVYGMFERIMEGMAVSLTAEHARVREQAYIFCRLLPFITCFVDNHLVPMGIHYDKPFDVTQLMDWVPVCTVDHVIFALSFFLPYYYPEAMDAVLTSMRNIMRESLKREDLYVTYGNATTRAVDPQEAKARSHFSAVAGGPAAAASSSLAAGQQASKPPKVVSLISNQMFSNRQNAQQVPGEDAYGYGDEEDDEEAAAAERRKRQTGGVDDKAESKKQSNKIDANYVTFNMGLHELQHRISIDIRGSPIQHSANAIEGCLHKLLNAGVKSRPFIVFEDFQLTPVADADVKEEGTYLAMTVPDVKKKVSVHYAMLNREKDYNNILERVLAAYAHKRTIEHKVLTGLPHETHPWLFKTINVKPNMNREMELANHSYINPAVFAILTGSCELDKVAERQNLHMKTMFDSCDEDTFALTNFMSNSKWYKIVGLMPFLRAKHWKFQVQAISELVKSRIIINDTTHTNGNEPTVIDYPTDIVVEYDAEKAMLENNERVEGQIVDDNMNSIALGEEFKQNKDKFGAQGESYEDIIETKIERLTLKDLKRLRAVATKKDLKKVEEDMHARLDKVMEGVSAIARQLTKGLTEKDLAKEDVEALGFVREQVAERDEDLSKRQQEQQAAYEKEQADAAERRASDEDGAEEEEAAADGDDDEEPAPKRRHVHDEEEEMVDDDDADIIIDKKGVREDEAPLEGDALYTDDQFDELMENAAET